MARGEVEEEGENKRRARGDCIYWGVRNRTGLPGQIAASQRQKGRSRHLSGWDRNKKRKERKGKEKEHNRDGRKRQLAWSQGSGGRGLCTLGVTKIYDRLDQIQLVIWISNSRSPTVNPNNNRPNLGVNSAEYVAYHSRL